MNIRKARAKDIPEIENVINYYAGQNKMLPRSSSELYENIRDFWVKEKNSGIAGCCALHIIKKDIAELKSLAIKQEFIGEGIGKELVKKCAEDALTIGIKKIFVLTQIPDYFKKLNFTEIDINKLPHKIWPECLRCPKFPKCDGTALLYKIN